MKNKHWMLPLRFCLNCAILAVTNGFVLPQLNAPRQVHTALPMSYNMGTLVNIDDQKVRDIYSMEKWAENYGVQKMQGFKLTSKDGKDYSVETKVDLPAGSTVLAVPDELILSASRVREEFGSALQAAEGEMINGGVEEQIPLFALFVKILAEYEAGDQSPYFPWLDSLPRRFQNGASMTGKVNDYTRSIL